MSARETASFCRCHNCECDRCFGCEPQNREQAVLSGTTEATVALVEWCWGCESSFINDILECSSMRFLPMRSIGHWGWFWNYSIRTVKFSTTTKTTSEATSRYPHIIKLLWWLWMQNISMKLNHIIYGKCPAFTRIVNFATNNSLWSFTIWNFILVINMNKV